MARKIIQILTLGERQAQVGALCDDGTVWFTSVKDGSWAQLSPIPQPEMSRHEKAKSSALNDDWHVIK